MEVIVLATMEEIKVELAVVEEAEMKVERAVRVKRRRACRRGNGRGPSKKYDDGDSNYDDLDGDGYGNDDDYNDGVELMRATSRDHLLKSV